MDDPASVPDSSWYIAMADGHWDQVAAPWGYRIGLPWTVSHLSRWAHVSTATAFLILAIVSSAMLIASLAFLLRDRWRVLPLLLFTPVAIGLSHAYFLPDLMHSALVAVFFVLLSLEWWTTAALLLLPMMLVRESTMLLTAVAIVVVFNRRWGSIAFAATLVGLLISHLAVPPLANVHGMSGLMYMALKVPFNAVKNLFGLVVVPNTLRGEAGYTCPPTFVFPLHLGRIRDVGVCRPDFNLPLTTLATMLTVFGTGPLMLWYNHALGRRAWPRVAMVYGLVAFALAPLLGAAVMRLASYGWPLFWLYLPRRKQPMVQWILYLLVSWLPTAFQPDDHPERAVWVVISAALLYSLAGLLIAREDLSDGPRCS